MQHCTLAGVCEKSKGNLDLFQEARACECSARVDCFCREDGFKLGHRAEGFRIVGSSRRYDHEGACHVCSACVGLSTWVLQQDA